MSASASNIVECVAGIRGSCNVHAVFPPLVGKSGSGGRYGKGDIGTGTWVRLCRLTVMAGAVFTVRVAAFEVIVPQVPVITTL